MARYRRRGHWRRGRDGRRHWVSTHYVNRSVGYSAGKRTSWISASPRQSRLSPQVNPPRYSQGRVIPNARCPICGAATYFYANERGSKVYFDELGPPWPKHPCITTSGVVPSRPPHPAAVSSSPPSRAASAPNATGYPASRRWMSPAQATSLSDSISNPPLLDGPWTIVSRLVLDGRILIHMHPLHRRDLMSAWQTPYAVMLNPGDLVFLTGGWISWFDLARFEVVTSPVAFIAMLSRPDSLLRRLFRRLMAGG
ncbi:hypothetical protein FHR38_000313 [Micromonospora polyrhachis]|uniref:Uncharacterized protein n=1 Tax=Micromonospora polyrhachis TaxID=1282883 RepID=A0A7W7SN16_9ACTN|nr:hypothetical protein [Micromonospora polyrhachis]